MAQPIEVRITTKIKGMWRVVLLGWAIRLWGIKQHVDVEIRA